MILLTGATGLVGSALLPRLTARSLPVRCLVRDPRRLGPERVRVQIALGDLTDPPSFRNAMRGVSTVVHLAAAIRDQRAGSIEELNGIASWRMVEAAERAGVERFVFFSALGAKAHDRTRFLRAKALAEDAVVSAGLKTTVVAPSIVYAPGDRWLSMLGRLSLLPLMPLSGNGRALFQPIWADDVADCVLALLERGQEVPRERHELAGPETLSHESIVRLVAEAGGRPRPLVKVPAPVVRRALKLGEALLGEGAPATWDEAELLEVSLTTPRGAAGANALGVVPRRMQDVLGLPGAAGTPAGRERRAAA
jgi:NADH dehydrogenase